FCIENTDFTDTVSIRSLVLVFAQILDPATAALRCPRLAYITPVQDQPVMRILQEFPRHMAHEFLLDLQHRLARGDTGTVADPEDMGVDRHHRMAESGVEYHVGGLAAHAGQGFQFFAGLRHLEALPGVGRKTDRKSTRLNSSHVKISYAVFCLK